MTNDLVVEVSGWSILHQFLSQVWTKTPMAGDHLAVYEDEKARAARRTPNVPFSLNVKLLTVSPLKIYLIPLKRGEVKPVNVIKADVRRVLLALAASLQKD